MKKIKGTLFDLCYELEALIDESESLQDADSAMDRQDRLNQSINSIEITIEERVSYILRSIKEASAMAGVCASEAKALAARAGQYERKARSLKDYLLAAMPGYKYEDEYGKLGWGRSKRVECRVGPEDLPEKYRRVKTTVEADKSALKKAIASGEQINGVEVVDVQYPTVK